MMTEISLNILDVTENSTRAGASVVHITVEVDEEKDLLRVLIEDNGCGMSKEQLASVKDPFFTTRTTRKVGLGVPFFREAALQAGGSFDIESEPGVGTKVTAEFQLSNIDRMPLGDITGTIHQLVIYHPDTDFVYKYIFNGNSFTMDTREFREILGDVPFANKEVSDYIKEYLSENKYNTDNGKNI